MTPTADLLRLPGLEDRTLRRPVLPATGPATAPLPAPVPSAAPAPRMSTQPVVTSPAALPATHAPPAATAAWRPSLPTAPLPTAGLPTGMPPAAMLARALTDLLTFAPMSVGQVMPPASTLAPSTPTAHHPPFPASPDDAALPSPADEAWQRLQALTVDPTQLDAPALQTAIRRSGGFLEARLREGDADAALDLKAVLLSLADVTPSAASDVPRDAAGASAARMAQQALAQLEGLQWQQWQAGRATADGANAGLEVVLWCAGLEAVRLRIQREAAPREAGAPAWHTLALEGDPPGLGPVALHAAIGPQAQVELTVWVQRPGTLHAAQQARPALADALHGQGLHLTRLDLRAGTPPAPMPNAPMAHPAQPWQGQA